MFALSHIRLHQPKFFCAIALLFAQASTLAQTQTWPPAAELRYQLKALQHSFPLKGEAVLKWTLQNETTSSSAGWRYQIQSNTKVMLLGKILEANSQGRIDKNGLAPEKFTEKRLNKAEVQTQFNDASGLIHFGDGIDDARLPAGVQDRTSVTWQLALLARNAKQPWQAGDEISLPVSSRRDVEVWRFKVLAIEILPSALGELPVLHLSKIASKIASNTESDGNNTKEQQIDLWFAPSLEWYPVKISFTDADGGHVEQTITQITKIEASIHDDRK
jgi:hypothetical protein